MNQVQLLVGSMTPKIDIPDNNHESSSISFEDADSGDLIDNNKL